MHSPRLRARFLTAMGLPGVAASVLAGCARGEPPKNASSQTPAPVHVPPSEPSDSSFATPPPDQPTPEAPPDPTLVPPQPPGAGLAPPAPPSAWNASYPLSGKPPSWCAQGNVRCQPARDTPAASGSSLGCPNSIEVDCGCMPGAMCDTPDAACNAPLHAAMTKKERSRVPTACCYDLPRHCVPPYVGRALRVDGELMFAESELRADWSDAANLGVAQAPRVDHFPVEQRAKRAEAWRHIAALEHASVASFARVSLQLMALGAPPDLLAQTHAAALDEIVHARLAYGLCSAFSGCDEGPGRLPVPAALIAPTDVASFARDTFLDACVEESVGAVAARTLAEQEPDPSVRAVLLRIADDEERHAELAWRTLAWAVRAGGAHVLRQLSRALAELAPARAADAVRARVLEELIEPCARALLEAQH